MSKSKKEVGEGDHKYRPLTLVLAVLYRCNIQEERKHYIYAVIPSRFQSREEGMTKVEAGVDVEDGEEKEQLLEV